MYNVITIGRQFGSGGRELGRRLAEELSFAYYDDEVLRAIAERTSLTSEYIEQVIEHKPAPLLPITIGRTLYAHTAPSFDQLQAVYREQSSIIVEMAEKSPCVIVGRCADYILRDHSPFNIFVYADMESRIARCRLKAREGEEEYSDKELEKRIKRVDKDRASYYEFYTGQTWGDPMNFDMCINTSRADIKKIARVLAPIFTGA